MKPKFVVGTGKASYWANSSLIHMTHLEAEMLIRFLVELGGPLSSLYQVA